MDEAKKKHGGPRPGAGRKREGEEVTIVVPIRLQPQQKDKLKRLGGAKWIRKKIDCAKEPGDK
jgi:hypothetical protein